MKFTYKELCEKELEEQRNNLDDLNIVKGASIELQVEDFLINATEEEFKEAFDKAINEILKKE